MTVGNSKWRFVTWNLDWWRSRIEVVPQRELLERIGGTVALQEVRGSVAREYERARPRRTVFSQAIHPGATWRWMGCGLMFEPGTEVLDAGVVPTLPKPQRSVWARVEIPSRGTMTVVSWHTPNKAGDGLATKMAAYRAMSQWLTDAPRPLLLGADLNTWLDPVDLAIPDRSHPFYEEHAFVGGDPDHGLVDAYRSVLASSGELERLRAAQSVEPLAVSYTLRSGVPHRMDRIFASPDVEPVDGRYEYDDSLRCGSDHALHWIDFR